MRKIAWATAVLAFFIVAFVGWELTYPSESDPKNLKYVLWKAGLYRMNLDSVTDTMIGDSGREKLVVGKTKIPIAGAVWLSLAARRRITVPAGLLPRFIVEESRCPVHPKKSMDGRLRRR